MENFLENNSFILQNVKEHKEEFANSISHAIGIPLSLSATICLILLSDKSNPLELISIIIFGFSLLLVYTASTLYHSATEKKLKEKLLALDHIAIYFVISGTYTPFLLLKFNTTLGWIIFSILWAISLIASYVKWYYRHESLKNKYNLISTILYLIMGWGIIYFLKPLIGKLDHEVLMYLLAGGISYTLGVIFYLWEKLDYNHAIWHLFVLVGSSLHVWSVYKLIGV